jgi:Flp pilus assembly protein TadD, contains TPR repeats
MKKNKVSFFATLLAAIVISSCGGLNKMKDTAKTISYSTTPSPLEVKGGQVDLTVNVKYPAKFFNKKAIVEVTPVLKYAGGETPFQSKTFQGEGVTANNEVVKYNEGGSKTISAGQVPFKKEMMVSTVEARVKATLGKSNATFPDVKIGDGVIATELLVVKDPRAIAVGDKFVRESSSQYEADIKYLINKADVRPSELKKDEIKKLQESLESVDKDPKKSIKGIELSAYASPDGPMDLNQKLADERKASANKYFGKDLVKKDKLTKVKDDLFTYLVTAEDWDGFKKLMEASDIKDKELVLRVLSMYSDPAVREKEIKNISAAFDEIKVKILPQLRRSKLTVKIVDSGKSDDELVALAQSKPDSLSLEELLYAAKMTDNLDKQLAIYQAAAAKYPNDFRAKNDAGYVLWKLNRSAEAKTAFESAKQVEDNAIVKNNLGVIAFNEGDLAKAEELFTAAMGAGDQVNYNLGIIKIIQGKYADAINYFGSAAEINAGLAKLLNKENDAALSTLNAVKSDDALLYYLKAIVGARTQNTDLLFNNLRTAVGKSAELKANAAKDLEFAKYFADATFKSIVQ